MSEAPELLWAWWDDQYDVGLVNTHGDKRYTPDEARKYVRADRIEELEAALTEQIQWVRELADDLIAAEGREAKLKAKLAKAVASLEALEDASKFFGSDRQTDRESLRYAHETTRRLCRTTLAELKGEDRG